MIHLRVVAASAPTGDCQWPEPRALSHQLERLTGRVAHPCMSHRGPLRRRTQEAVWGEAVEAGWTADRPTETEISRAVPDVARRAQTLICAHCDGAGRLHGRSAAAAAANRVPSGPVVGGLGWVWSARASERASDRPRERASEPASGRASGRASERARLSARKKQEAMPHRERERERHADRQRERERES